MFDTHCHLNFDVFEENLNEVVNSARENGVENFLIPGTNLEDSKRAIEIAEHYADIYAAVGIHPTQDLEKKDKNKLFYDLNKLPSNKKVVAIGEIGLDYYRFKSPSRLQINFLQEQIKIAIKNDLAIILHNRQASDDLIKVLTRMWTKGLEQRVVFHCVEPNKKLLDFAVNRNIFMGINGDVTYDPAKQDFVKSIPLNLLLLETDSPFLIPEPFRSNKVFPNEPKNLKLILKKIAEIKNLSEEKIKTSTSRNAKKLFAVD